MSGLRDVASVSLMTAYMFSSHMMQVNPLQVGSYNLGALEQLAGAIATLSIISIAGASRRDWYFVFVGAQLASLVARGATLAFPRFSSNTMFVGAWDASARSASRLGVALVTWLTVTSIRGWAGLLLFAALWVMAFPAVTGNDIETTADEDSLVMLAFSGCENAALYMKGRGASCVDAAVAAAIRSSSGIDAASLCKGFERKGSVDRVVISKDGGTLVIAISATMILDDWGYNFSYVRLDNTVAKIPELDGCGVHAGYKKLYYEIISGGGVAAVLLGEGGLLYKGLFRSDTGVNRVLVAGHSLGGAVACVMAVHIAMRLGPSVPVDCVSFGAPQVGDAAFAAKYKSLVDRSIRIVNPYDPVPYSFDMGLKHVDGRFAVVGPLIYNVLPYSSHQLSMYRKAWLDHGSSAAVPASITMCAAVVVALLTAEAGGGRTPTA